MEITEQDKKMFIALKHLLSQGSFTLKWREATAFFAIQKWMKDFEEKMNEKPKPKGRKRVNKSR